MSLYEFRFTSTAVRDLKKLPRANQKRIGQKLDFFRHHPNPLDFAAPLVGRGKVGQYRFRVGDYRVIFNLKAKVLIILIIEHRREVYRRR